MKIKASTLNPIHLGSERVVCVVLRRSNRPMITTRDVSLKAEMRIPSVGGITIFNACGRIMSRIF